jgi:Na+/H+-dicarboxylate symporter
MLEGAQASSVGWKTVVVYLATTCVTATISVLLSTAFVILFSDGTAVVTMTSKLIKLGFNSGQNGYVMQGTDGTLSCSTATDSSKLSTFLLHDVNSVFSSKSTIIRKINVSDGLREYVFIQMVPSNIVTALGTDNFLGVIYFASVFAIACFKMRNRP